MENHLESSYGPLYHHRGIGGGMAYLYRLVVAVLLLIPQLAFSAFAPATNYAFPSTGYGPAGPALSSVLAACQWGLANRMGTGSGQAGYATTAVLNPTSCNYYFASGSLGATYGTLTSSAACPSGSTGTTSCTCTAPLVEDLATKTCKAAPVSQTDADVICQALNFLGAPLVVTGTASLSTCYAGVTVTGSGSASGGGTAEIYGPFKCPGNSSACAAPTAPPAKLCPKGTFTGTVNGLSVCVPATNAVAAGPSTLASAPSGAASAPPIEGAPAGSTGSTNVTNCAAGACTTTTTYTGSGGATTGTKDVVETEASYCQKNPLASICKAKTDSSFSGSCTVTPTCNGDAVQCAQAAQALKTACAFESTAAKTTEEDAYTAGLLKTGDQTTSLSTNPATVALSGSSFDQTELLGAAVGMRDVTVTVFRSTVVLPFSTVNIWLSRLGLIFQAVTFLLCMRIVGRG